MKDVLSEKAVESLYEEGFVRTGIQLSDLYINQICNLFNDLPASETNWGYFQTGCLSNHNVINNWEDFKTRLVRKYLPSRIHRHVREVIYDKAIYGSSAMLRPVLEECIRQGLAGHLSKIPLLVGHDIYLENSRDKSTFGFHTDSFGWDIFYQTGDDVTAYIALQDLNVQKGGRLYVERHANTAIQHKDRNQYIRSFVEYCREYVSTNQRGLVTRESITGSKNRKMMAREFMRVLENRYALAIPDMRNMRPVNALKGEVILFNNKNFHSVEPWKGKEKRKNYIIRLFPLYNMGMEPPTTFLNKAPCNQLLITGNAGTLENFNLERNPIQFSEIQ